ncbi:NAD-binding protein [Dendrothele bispora CBS 962.96]|uniref:NAD-binding protein n=1 Tax=Dendrothele bispora (strain CBS 962.96) TaxID=1314807 RepID=A0A4S8M3X3_DENBC|nr:NAD-binding protein [Dendrothele bispora CBS 962.96]
MSTSKNIVLVTGAAGFLGSLVAQAIQDDPQTPNVHLILADIVEPTAPSNTSGNVITLKVDLTEQSDIEKLFETKLGIPDTVYCMHGIMSRGSEDNFDLGLKVNIDSVRGLLQAARKYGQSAENSIKFIFTSSLAVYGGPLPDVVVPSTIATPEGAYGMAKLCCEFFINEYTRRGFVNGRILRLPTIAVRGGAPAAASSSFISGIIREPMKGLPTVCPIGNSLDSPELDLALWISSPRTVVRNLVIAKHIPDNKFVTHTRVVCAPGFTTTVREELEALRAVSGNVMLQSGKEVDVLELIEFKDDPTNRRIVASWPARFDNSYAFDLGLVVDEGGMIGVVEEFKRELERGRT